MTTNWNEVPVSKAANIFLGGTPSRSVPEYWDGGIKWATARDVANCRIRYLRQTEETISSLGIDNSAAKLLNKDTVVITARGTVGAICLLGERMAFNQTCYGLQAKQDVESIYLYYALKSRLAQIGMLSYGTVFNTITMRTFNDLVIPVPPAPEQRAIAAILGALDDKIELNRRMNQTLEAMAQAIFKSWFVDFEPFRNQGMEDSPLGTIPRGWSVGTIGDLAQVTSGKRPLDRMPHPTDNYLVPLYGGAGPMAWVKEPLYYEPLLIIGRVGTLGVVNRTAKPCWPSDNTLVVLVKSSAAYPFLYCSMKRFDFDSLNRGSTQPLVTQSDLSNVKLALPPMRILQSFSDIVYPMFQLQDANVEQSASLAAIRDTLLPKLLSGKIRIKDAEKFVEKAV